VHVEESGAELQEGGLIESLGEDVCDLLSSANPPRGRDIGARRL
jgi:hypothetical protein